MFSLLTSLHFVLSYDNQILADTRTYLHKLEKKHMHWRGIEPNPHFSTLVVGWLICTIRPPARGGVMHVLHDCVDRSTSGCQRTTLDK